MVATAHAARAPVLERRVLFAELALIRDSVIKHPIDDRITLFVQGWLTRFHHELKSHDDREELLKKYAQELKITLVNPLQETPLEEVCYLGSDGLTWGEKALSCLLSELPYEFRDRSPSYPEEKKCFFVVRHFVAESAVHFLQKHGLSDPLPAQIESTYRTLAMEKRLPVLPLRGDEPIRLERIFEHTHRTRLLAELAVINELLRQPFTDETTEKIHKWHGEFVLAIRHKEDPREDIETFKISLLSLIGPCAEKKSYLGSDGNIYGKKYLYTRLADLPLGFYAQRHPIVEGAYLWLSKNGITLEVPIDVLETYHKMKLEGLPELPLDPIKARRRERIYKLREARVERERKEKEAKEMARKAAEDTAKAFVDEAMRAFHEEIHKMEAEEEVRTEKAKARHRELDTELSLEEADWASKNEILKRRLDELDERIDQIWSGASVAESAISSLERSIAETTKAIEEKNSRDANTAWATIAKVAACAVASYFTGMAISQPPGGGITLGTTFPI